MKASELLVQFVQEARECLEQIGEVLLEVERNPSDSSLLNNLFRLVHTLKGNCGLFDFKPLEMVVHAGEDLLDQVRSGELLYSEDMADTLLSAMDFTACLVEEIERTGVISHEAVAQATQQSLQLRAYLQVQLDEGTNTAIAEVSVASTNDAPDWLQSISVALKQTYPQAVAWRYVPEPECFFKGEDPWLYVREAPALLHVQVQAAQPWPEELAQWDCYACNLEIIALSNASIEDVEAHFRYVPEQVTVLPLPAVTQDVYEDAREPVESEALPQALLQAAHRIWNDQNTLLAYPQVAAGSMMAARVVYASILQVLGDAASQAALQSLAALPRDVSAPLLLQWAAQHAPFGSAQISEQAQSLAGSQTVSAASGAASGLHEEAGPLRQLKVSQEKIDRLMDLIGEMVVAKNALPYLAQRAEAVFQQRELAREIKAQYAVINRIAEDMQYAIMQVRMMPVGAVFQRFGRLVRDTSKKLGKDVQLVIEGEDTEADKNVIEALADPLIHILRNSLDHGIEMPQVRMAGGKPARGTISVKARQESDRVIIEISDDGAGIHAQRVRDKAVERGLIPAEKADQLTDAEAAQLIFLPGFSTAEKVSDLSGRGVGMDVVRSAVERINGQVELSSMHRQGTSIQLSLPLSMAVTNVMIVEAAGRRFGVPMDLIVETVRVHAEEIHHFKQAQTTVLRGKIVPLQALHHMLDLGCGPVQNSDQEYAVLVIRLGAENLGLLVDQFHGASDIILKPLEGVLAGLAGFSGTALMGDGSVLMVLNPKELC